jgi:hypothetical protein
MSVSDRGWYWVDARLCQRYFQTLPIGEPKVVRVPPKALLGPQSTRPLVLPASPYSPRVASQSGSIRDVHEV